MVPAVFPAQRRTFHLKIRKARSKVTKLVFLEHSGGICEVSGFLMALFSHKCASYSCTCHTNGEVSIGRDSLSLRLPTVRKLTSFVLSSTGAHLIHMPKKHGKYTPCPKSEHRCCCFSFLFSSSEPCGVSKVRKRARGKHLKRESEKPKIYNYNKGALVGKILWIWVV